MICTSLGNISFDRALEKVRHEVIVELRLDLLKININQIKVLCSQKAKTIASFFPGKVSDGERLEKLKTAILAGVTFVETGWDSGEDFLEELVPFARGNNCRVIITFMDMEKTPVKRELEHIVKECSMSGADIVKIVCKVNSTEDNARLLSLYSMGKNLIAVGLGSMGKITKLAAPMLGAEFTYASLGQGLDTEDGKINKSSLERTLNSLWQGYSG